jgi:hypothetical protein
MKTYGEEDVLIHIFLTSALAEDEWSASRPCRFASWEGAPGTHSIGDWLDPRAGLNNVEIILDFLDPTGTRSDPSVV